MTIRELFRVAVNGDTKAERRNAFRQLREIAARGNGQEATEAREALQDSARYAQKIKEENDGQ